MAETDAPIENEVPDDEVGLGEIEGACATEGDGRGAAEVEGAPVPPEVTDLVAACVDYATRAVGVTPDLTPETLPLIDHYLATAAADVEGRPAALRIITHAGGAYIGEVIRRAEGGWWHAEGDDPTTWEVRFGHVFLAVNPFAFAYSAMTGDEPDEGLRLDDADHDDVATYLASLPPLDPADYLRPSTRVELVQTLIQFLHARAEQAGMGEVVFHDHDYE